MKKFSRMLFVLCLLMALVCLVSATAFAEDAEIEIHRADVYLQELVIGQEWTMPTVPADANYTVSGSWRYDGGASGYYTTVQNGAHYYLLITLTPNEGYKFSEDLVMYLNGEAYPCEHYTPDGIRKVVRAHYERSFKTPIETVSVSYDLSPELGSNTSSYTIEGGHPEQYSVKVSVYPLESTSVFEAGIIYRLSIQVTPYAAYEFTEDTVLVVNGETRSVNLAPYSSFYLFSDEIAYGEPITAVDFPQWYTDIQPGHPGAEVELPMPEDVNYTVTAKWRACDSEGIPSTLLDGKLYRLTYTAKPKPGYYFAVGSPVTMAGVPMEQQVASKASVAVTREYGMNVQYVDSLDVSYIRPRVGDEQKNFTFSLGDAAKNKWSFGIYNLDKGPYHQDATFLADTTYTVRTTIRANQYYAFADTITVTCNGENPVQITPTDRMEAELSFEIEYARPVEKVEFPAWPETVEPGAGGVTQLPSPEGYILNRVWMDMRTGEVVETLEAGDTYTLAYTAEPAPGYIFDESTVATVGGEAAQVHKTPLFIVAYRSYDLGAQKIDRVELNIPKLYKGCTPGAVTVADGANYALWEVLWLESATDSFGDAQPVDVASYGTYVYMLPVLCAGDGYVFDANVRLFFNGQEVPVAYFTAEGPVLELAGLYGTLLAPDNGWVQEDNTWAFYVSGVKKTNSWMKDSKGWCYLGSDGLMLKEDWAKDSKGWCYLGSDGYMVYDKWVLWKDGWYFLNKNGYMLSNTWKKDYKDWCYLGASGRMLTNAWKADSKGWCYLGEDGYMLRSAWAADSYGICWLNADGYLSYNTWVQDADGWRYVGSDGYMVINNWAYTGGYWYAFDEYGVMFSDTVITYRNKYYKLDAGGRMLTNTWFMVNGYWSYVNADGYIPLNTWVRDSKGWCYIGSGGLMETSTWIEYNGNYYYVGSDGYMYANRYENMYPPTGLFMRVRYYFDANGVAHRQNMMY